MRKKKTTNERNYNEIWKITVSVICGTNDSTKRGNQSNPKRPLRVYLIVGCQGIEHVVFNKSFLFLIIIRI